MIKKREKLRKHRRKKERENEEIITDVDIDLLVVTMVYYFFDEEDKCRKKITLLSCKWKFETLLCTNEQKFDKFFFSFL